MSTTEPTTIEFSGWSVAPERPDCMTSAPVSVRGFHAAMIMARARLAYRDGFALIAEGRTYNGLWREASGWTSMRWDERDSVPNYRDADPILVDLRQSDFDEIRVSWKALMGTPRFFTASVVLVAKS